MTQGFGKSDYMQLITRVQSSLDALIFEIEHELVNNVSAPIDREYRFEVIPLLRRLKEARKESHQATLFLD